MNQSFGAPSSPALLGQGTEANVLTLVGHLPGHLEKHCVLRVELIFPVFQSWERGHRETAAERHGCCERGTSRTKNGNQRDRLEMHQTWCPAGLAGVPREACKALRFLLHDRTPAAERSDSGRQRGDSEWGGQLQWRLAAARRRCPPCWSSTIGPRLGDGGCGVFLLADGIQFLWPDPPGICRGRGLLPRSMEAIGDQNCQSQLGPQFGEEGRIETKGIVEDVWLLQKVFGILQSVLAVGGRGGWVQEGGAGDVRNPPRTQTPAFRCSLWGGRGLVYAPRRDLHSL